MANPDAVRWDARYSEEGKAWLDRSPRQLLVSNARLLPDRGLALDAAAGVGTNALFLAQRGLRVIALDISEVGLHLARRRFTRHGYQLAAAAFDLTRPWLPAECFDVILNFHFLARGALPVYHRALKPGGLLFFETFLAVGEGAVNPDYYLEPGELLAYYGEFEILRSGKNQITSDLEEQMRVTEQLVARKPS